MALKVKFKSRRQKANMQEAFELCLAQKRHGADGNRVDGYTFEQIMAMTPHEREYLLQGIWIHERFRATQDRRKA